MEENNISKITKCVGCKNCGYSCPQKAISFEMDDLGFYYPRIDKSKCNNCGLCLSKCPSYKIIKNEQSEKVYAYENKKHKKQSSSGGAFKTLALDAIDKGMIVYGAAFDDKLQLKHCRVDDKLQLNKLCRSKYIQSDMEETYSLIKKI